MSVEEEMVESEEVVEEIESEESEEETELDEPSESEESTESEEETEEDDEEDEDFITLGDEEAPASEDHESVKELPKKLREEIRERNKKIRGLEQKLEQLTATETKPVTLSPEPELEDYDYDTDKYKQAMAEWFTQKNEHEKAEQEKEQQAQAWNKTLETYAEKKSSLKVSDYDEAEYTVLETLSETQQGIILQGADDPALLVYALGKNPKRAKELADIKDPVKFSFAVSKLETTVKKNSRRKAPPAEKTVSGTGKGSAIDSTLDKLRAEAEKTGNYSKVRAYKAKTKNKG